jgi:hypothetical protein
MASNLFEPVLVASASQSTQHQRTFRYESLASSGSKIRQFRVGFQPCDYSVVCGRGKESFNHVGNQRFRALASKFMERYSRAVSKTAKSAIVSDIIDVIHQAGGHFCKYKRGTDTWFEVGDHFAREKVSALLRDLLHNQYRSSAKAKLNRHQQKTVSKQKLHENSQSGQKQVERTEDSGDSSTKQVEGTEDSDDSSTTSSCWGRSKDSLGFEYWLEESDDFFDIDVF